MNQKSLLQDSKNEEYDKTAEFVKEIRIKQTESESNQKSEIETLKGIVSKVQFKQETRDDEMKQLKGRLNQMESNVLIDHYHRHHVVKRQNSVTSKSSTTERLPCTPKNPCVFDYKNSSNSSDTLFSNTKKITICIPKNACAFDFRNPPVSTTISEKVTTYITTPSVFASISKSVNPPSSCKDLSTNGHTSNGIYVLYDSNVKKASIALCDFDNNKGKSDRN